jgi:hypothetical protein
MVTTPVAILSKVCAQFAGVPGIPRAGAGVRAGVAGAALNTGVTDNANKDKSNEMRDMPILGLNDDYAEGSDKLSSQTFL